ncbi:GAF domain protein [metagenome]|uniref:GAF domain protein n=1 Tax=metagenome TaxID=256318 RepID=A0A2P2C9I2_9ZZZZ
MPDSSSSPGALPSSARVLLDAVIAISSALDLHHVLDQIVVSSCELTGARYGALGVIGSDGLLSDFITHGLDRHQREQIGEPPRGRGILRLLIDHPEPLRLPHLQDHPTSYGFPPNHPPMTSFLGVPVRIRGTVFGNLYLTEKAGGEQFSEQDESLVVALASAAGFVIENARAYAMSERQRTWLEAAARLHEVLQAPLQLEAALPHIASGARAVSQALSVGVFALDEAGEPVLAAVDGREADRVNELVADLSHQLRGALSHGLADDVLLAGKRRAFVLPLRTRLLSPLAVVVVVDAYQSATRALTQEKELITSYAEQAALALDRVQALADRQELAIVSDRERIARDLHDLVIQRLFATGLQLQGTRAKAGDPAVQSRLDQAVADLDSTIRDIRSTIFELQHAGERSVRHDVRELVQEYQATLGFTPTLRTLGPVDTVLSGSRLHEHLLAVLREALSNVARHAGASAASVEIDVVGGDLVLRVADDGCGLPERRDESGLLNVRQRAEALGGRIRLIDREPKGTVLEWTVPLGS